MAHRNASPGHPVRPLPLRLPSPLPSAIFTVGIISRDHVSGHLLPLPPGEETPAEAEVASISCMARH